MRILEFGAFWTFMDDKVKKTMKSPKKPSEWKPDGVMLYLVMPSLDDLELEDFTHVAPENFGEL